MKPESSTNHPLLQYFKEGNKNKEKGWLKNLVQPDETKKKALTTTTKNLLLVLYALFLGPPNIGKTYGRMANLAKTFGLTEPRLQAIYREFVARNFETERKERRDKGETIFNSDKKERAPSLRSTCLKNSVSGNFVMILQG